MKTKTEIPLNYAERLATDVIYQIKGMCNRIEVAGSIRRRRPIVHDVDIVLIPQPFTWLSMIPKTLITKLDAEIVRDGPLIKQFIIRGITIDLIHATHDNWGIRMLRWTGSKQHNIMLCGRAKQLNMKLAVSKGLLDKDGKILEAKNEYRIFNLLHLDYVEPEKREA